MKFRVGESVQAVGVTVNSFDPSTTKLSSCDVRYDGWKLTGYQYYTLIRKQMAYFLHAPFTLLFLVILFSSILFALLLFMSKILLSSYVPNPPLDVSSLSVYTDYPKVLFFQGDRHVNSSVATEYFSRLPHAFKKLSNFSHDVSITAVSRRLKSESLRDPDMYWKRYLVGGTFGLQQQKSLQVNGYFSQHVIHSAPLSLNLIYETLIKMWTGVEANIQVTNHPFQLPNMYRWVDEDSMKREEKVILNSATVIFLVVVMSLITGTMAILPTEERLNKGKQLQMMTGVTPSVYWGAMFTWDFLFYTFINILLTMVYVLADYFNGNWFYTNNGAGAFMFLIFECYSFGAILFAYVISWSPKGTTGSDGFLLVNKIAIGVGIVGSIIRYLPLIFIGPHHYGPLESGLYYFSKFCGYILWIVPMHSLFSSMIKLQATSFPNSHCNWFSDESLKVACDSNRDLMRNSEVRNLSIFRCCGEDENEK